MSDIDDIDTPREGLLTITDTELWVMVFMLILLAVLCLLGGAPLWALVFCALDGLVLACLWFRPEEVE